MTKQQKTEVIDRMANSLEKEDMRDLLLYLATQNKTVQDAVIGFFEGTEELQKAIDEVL